MFDDTEKKDERRAKSAHYVGKNKKPRPSFYMNPNKKMNLKLADIIAEFNLRKAQNLFTEDTDEEAGEEDLSDKLAE